jgi:ABC-2 type transport system ATP-binding protein
VTALAIEVEGLTKSFNGRIAVKNVSIQMPTGEVWGFLGPNGSGKTTTIRMLCGLLRPDAGRGTCLGLDIIKESDEIKRQVGYMTQRFSFWEDLSIRENLEFIARIYDMPDRERRVSEAIEHLGLSHRQDQLAGALSGGWKQRMALAACILHDPKLLLLDEPTAGVDPQARRDFWDEIHHLASRGLTVLVSTHYMDEAERCDRIVYIANGEIIARGTVADVVASSGLTTWIVEGEHVRLLLGDLENSPGVEHAAFFGAALHVSGHDRKKLDEAIAPYRKRPGLTWTETTSSLEDVFIDLMHRHGADRR